MLIRLGGLLTVIGLAVWLWAVFDALFTPADRIRVLPKAVWVILILLFTTVGAIGWLVLGRPRSRGPKPGPTRVTAPDDDPEFLRGLTEELRRRRDEPI